MEATIEINSNSRSPAMGQRVTIQDIADALGLSRNTVSKAINNTGILAEDTRAKILRKAAEMGYKQFSYLQLGEPAKAVNLTLLDNLPQSVGQKRDVAVLFGGYIGGSHFAVTMLDRLQHELAEAKLSMTMYRVMESEIASCSLPASFDRNNALAIISIEIFDPSYCRMLCDTEIPYLMIDGPVTIFDGSFPADQLIMESQSQIYKFMKAMTRQGKTSFGFAGDFRHCQSFYERYSAFRQYTGTFSLKNTGSITDQVHYLDRSAYLQTMKKAVLSMNEFPEVYICANDAIAIDLIPMLEKRGLKIPDDILICGFDDTPESKIMSPSLTTIHIHSQIMGTAAAGLIYSRIINPDLDYRTLYTETELILRESTKSALQQAKFSK